MNSFVTWELAAIVHNDLGMVASRSDRLLTSASRNRVNFICTGNLNAFFSDIVYAVLYNKNMSKLKPTSLDIYNQWSGLVYTYIVDDIF